MVIVVVSRIGKLRGAALPMRMENQHWMRWHGIVGVVPSVCLLFTSICFHRGRGRFNAHRDIRAPDDRPLRSVKMEREGRGKKEGEREGNYRWSLAIRLWRFITFFN